MLLHESIIHSFFLPSSSPWSGCVTVGLTIYPLKDICSFQSGAIMNKAAQEHPHTTLCIYNCFTFGHTYYIVS